MWKKILNWLRPSLAVLNPDSQCHCCHAQTIDGLCRTGCRDSGYGCIIHTMTDRENFINVSEMTRDGNDFDPEGDIWMPPPYGPIGLSAKEYDKVVERFLNREISFEEFVSSTPPIPSRRKR